VEKCTSPTTTVAVIPGEKRTSYFEARRTHLDRIKLGPNVRVTFIYSERSGGGGAPLLHVNNGAGPILSWNASHSLTAHGSSASALSALDHDPCPLSPSSPAAVPEACNTREHGAGVIDEYDQGVA